ncbi:uncharacterized protein J3D65DRAFT_44827 [Phyllosticta citribraziliensis]|uniref:Uncharacterized protein n=1 Tax=Phyllosticta citribraziliensis TaxID=989973 RepID=A0ABR1MCH8_9PEZI
MYSLLHPQLKGLSLVENQFSETSMAHALLWKEVDPNSAVSSRFSFICVFDPPRGSAKAMAVCVDHAQSHIDEEDGAFLGLVESSATLARIVLTKSTSPPGSNSTNTVQSYDNSKTGRRQECDQGSETEKRETYGWRDRKHKFLWWTHTKCLPSFAPRRFQVSTRKIQTTPSATTNPRHDLLPQQLQFPRKADRLPDKDTSVEDDLDLAHSGAVSKDSTMDIHIYDDKESVLKGRRRPTSSPSGRTAIRPGQSTSQPAR